LRAAYRYPLDPLGVPALSGSAAWLAEAVSSAWLKSEKD
jgi:hypothetical protein